MTAETKEEREQQEKVSASVKRQTYVSRLGNPIADKSLLQKALLFAELSTIAYATEEETRKLVAPIGFSKLDFFDRDGSQAYLLSNDVDTVVAFRGTEPNEWNDIRADANAITAMAETFGRVHRGFKQEVDDLWPRLEKALIDNKNTLWFTGHSLGGAMATICAGRCLLSHIRATPEGLFSFGSPRVGDKRYVNYCKLNHFRFVNNNDIVTRVPPPWFGYRHAGQEMYFNARGKLRKLTPWQRTKDRWRGFLGGLRGMKIDHFSDHSMLDYIKHIKTAIQEGGEELP